MAPLVRLRSPLHPSGKESCRQVGELGCQASRLMKTGRTPESLPPRRKRAVFALRTANTWGRDPGSGRQRRAGWPCQWVCTHTTPVHTPHRVARNHSQPVSLYRKLGSLHAIPTTTTSLMIYFVFISSSLNRKLRQEERINMGFNSRPKSNERGEERGAPGREPAWWRACEQY